MKEWYSAKEAADYVGLCYDYFRELVKRGSIYHPPRNKRKYRFKKEWLENYLMGGNVLPPIKRVVRKYKHLEL